MIPASVSPLWREEPKDPSVDGPCEGQRSHTCQVPRTGWAHGGCHTVVSKSWVFPWAGCETPVWSLALPVTQQESPDVSEASSVFRKLEMLPGTQGLLQRSEAK